MASLHRAMPSLPWCSFQGCLVCRGGPQGQYCTIRVASTGAMVDRHPAVGHQHICMCTLLRIPHNLSDRCAVRGRWCMLGASSPKCSGALSPDGAPWLCMPPVRSEGASGRQGDEGSDTMSADRAALVFTLCGSLVLAYFGHSNSVQFLAVARNPYLTSPPPPEVMWTTSTSSRSCRRGRRACTTAPCPTS